MSVTRYAVDCASGAAGVSSTLRVADRYSTSASIGPPPLTGRSSTVSPVTVAGERARSKVTRTVVSVATPVAPEAGVLELTWGVVPSPVVKVQVVGAGRGCPVQLLTSVPTRAVYAVIGSSARPSVRVTFFAALSTLALSTGTVSPPGPTTLKSSAWTVAGSS